MGVNKVAVGGEVRLDLTEDTVSENNLLAGVTAHNAAGEAIVGAVVTAPIDSELSETSENPVQNKAIKAALNNKAAADHTHNYAGESSKGGFMSADDKTKLDSLSKITVERFDATTDAWSHVKLFATGGKVPIAAVFVYNSAMYSIFVFNTDYYIELYDTSMNAIPNTAVSFDLICKEG